MSLKEALKKYKDFENKRKGRYLIIKPYNFTYKFDKRIFRYCFIILALFFVIVMASQGFNISNERIYYKCPLKDGVPCDNPFYCDDNDIGCSVPEWVKNKIPNDLLDRPVVPPGFEYGEKPIWPVTHAEIIVFMIIIIGFLINDRFNNRGFPWRTFFSFLKNDINKEGR